MTFMIGNALRIDIEQWVGRRGENAVFANAMAGTMTGDRLSRYLASLHYMIQHTPIHLKRARERARTLGDEALCRHFEHKFGEEQGHDVWAENDLETLERTHQSTSRGEVMPGALLLARHIEATIDDKPALYLAYIAFVEYMTVMVGPEWMSYLEERCGIARTNVSVIDEHIELDREHAEEGFAVMDDLVGDPAMLTPMRDALRQFMAMFDTYCAEAMDISAVPVPEESCLQVRAQVVAADVSAA